jgi:hypothetical protein
MSLSRKLGIGAVTAAMLAVPVIPVSAASGPTLGGCKPYPPSAPKTLTLHASPTSYTAGQSTLLFGAFKKGKCPIQNATIILRREKVINGHPMGGFYKFATVTTNSKGTFSTTAHFKYSQAVQAKFKAAGGFTGETSNIVIITVRTKITEAVGAPGKCRLTFSGSTYPRQSGKTVKIQKRAKTFNGWTTIAQTTTNSYGRYHVSKKLTCGARYNVSAYIGKTTRNAAGRSATVFGIKAKR